MADNNIPKAELIDKLQATEDVSAQLRLCAQLKVALLADDGLEGGLSATSRRRAWDMVRDLTKLIVAEPQAAPVTDEIRKIINSAMAWQPSENGPSYDQRRDELFRKLDALATSPLTRPK